MWRFVWTWCVIPHHNTDRHSQHTVNTIYTHTPAHTHTHTNHPHTNTHTTHTHNTHTHTHTCMCKEPRYHQINPPRGWKIPWRVLDVSIGHKKVMTCRSAISRVPTNFRVTGASKKSIKRGQNSCHCRGIDQL